MNNFTDLFNVAWITGMPRSGTTWLSQILASSPDVRLKFCPLFSYDFKNKLDESSSSDDWSKLFFDVYHTNSDFLDQDYLRKKNLVPSFSNKNDSPSNLVIKSTRFHNLTPTILQLQEDIKFIHLVRHPCASIYSWLTNPGEFPSGANYLTEWRTGRCRKTGVGEFWGFDDWKNVTTQALRLEELYPDRYKVLRYEHLVGSTKSCTQELFNYLGLAYESQTDNFIMKSHSRHDVSKRSVYKDPSLEEKWLSGLDRDIIYQCLYEIEGTELEKFISD
jgi:hypothetical protein